MDKQNVNKAYNAILKANNTIKPIIELSKQLVFINGLIQVTANFNSIVLTLEQNEQLIFDIYHSDKYIEYFSTQIDNEISLEELAVDQYAISKLLNRKKIHSSYQILIDDAECRIRKLKHVPEIKFQQFDFENNTGFIHLPTEKIYNYFKTSLVDTKYLDLETFHKYLKAAFENCTPPEEKFQIIKQGLTKQKIKKIWIEFSTIKQGENSVPYRQKTNYVRLLTEYFEGFNFNSISVNWQ